jgi:hypothetical protein
LRPFTGIAISIRASQPIARRKSDSVDAGRRDFEPVGLAHRLLEVEHRRQRLARAFAIADRHGPVRTLGHDLHRRALGRGNLHPDDAQSEIAQHRLGDARDAPREADVVDEARLEEPFVGRGRG